MDEKLSGKTTTIAGKIVSNIVVNRAIPGHAMDESRRILDALVKSEHGIEGIGYEYHVIISRVAPKRLVTLESNQE